MKHYAWQYKPQLYSASKPAFNRDRPVPREHAKTCRCTLCMSYLALIKQLNPARWAELTDEPVPYIRRQSEREKQFALDRHKRDTRHSSTPKWR